MTKPNCYDCQYRGGVPGDAHSCCNHPSNRATMEDPFLQVMSIFASVGRTAPVVKAPNDLNIKANPHGIKKGWFNYPINFDPVWLENCDGFKEKVKNAKL